MLKQQLKEYPKEDVPTSEAPTPPDAPPPNKYNTPPYKRSRIAYNAEALLEYLISLTLVDAFLAVLGKSIGMSDALLGICGSLVSFAGLTQVFTVFFSHRKPVKKRIFTVHLINNLMFAALYILPFFSGVSKTVKIVLFFALLLSGRLLLNMVASTKYVLAMSSVERHKYGVFSTTKEMISLAAGMAFEYAIGWVSDYYRSIGQEKVCFLLFAITIVVITALHAVSVSFLHEDKSKYEDMPEEDETLAKRVSDMLGLLKNKRFLQILAVFFLWRIADYISSPFMGTYAIDLAFTLTDVSILAIIGSAIRFVLSRPVGKFADKTSYCTMLIPIFGLVTVAFIFGAFAAPGTAWSFAVYRITRAAAYVGINSATSNLMLDYVPREKSDYAIALNSCIIGLAGFGSTLLGSALLSNIQKNGNTLFGIPVFAQQVLCAISAILTVVIILYLALFVRKLKRNV